MFQRFLNIPLLTGTSLSPGKVITVFIVTLLPSPHKIRLLLLLQDAGSQGILLNRECNKLLETTSRKPIK